MAKKKLKAKREQFCQEYVIDSNGTQAAIRAKYSIKTAQEQASRLLSNVIIQKRIAELRQKQQERTQITADSVIKRLNEVAERCLQEVEPILDKKGNETGEYRFEAAGANRALELIGKHLGIFEKDNEQRKPQTVVSIS